MVFSLSRSRFLGSRRELSFNLAKVGRAFAVKKYTTRSELTTSAPVASDEHDPWLGG